MIPSKACVFKDIYEKIRQLISGDRIITADAPSQHETLSAKHAEHVVGTAQDRTTDDDHSFNAEDLAMSRA